MMYQQYHNNNNAIIQCNNNIIIIKCNTIWYDWIITSIITTSKSIQWHRVRLYQATGEVSVTQPPCTYTPFFSPRLDFTFLFGVILLESFPFPAPHPALDEPRTRSFFILVCLFIPSHSFFLPNRELTVYVSCWEQKGCFVQSPVLSQLYKHLCHHKPRKQRTLASCCCDLLRLNY